MRGRAGIAARVRDQGAAVTGGGCMSRSAESRTACPSRRVKPVFQAMPGLPCRGYQGIDGWHAVQTSVARVDWQRARNIGQCLRGISSPQSPRGRPFRATRRRDLIPTGRIRQ